MYASVIERTGWTLEYISEVPCLQALEVLGQAWEEENLEIEGKARSNTSSRSKAVDVDPISMPNVWDGKKEGTSANAKSFANMLSNTR